MRNNSGKLAGDPYGRRGARSQRVDLYDDPIGGVSGSGRRRKGFLQRMSAVFGSCFGPRKDPFRSTGGEGTSRDVSQASSMFTAASNASGGNGLKNSRKSMYGFTYNSTINDPGTGGMTFTLDDIKRATRNFSPSQKIGQGGFGTVYKGALYGKEVAIKRGKKSSHDKQMDTEFRSEISTMACIEHLNLVKFMGYLEEGEEKIIVVDYVPNGTLREHLDGVRGRPLDLLTRLDIAVDVAHAITYLHMYADQPIIHRDIKSSNILLTENLRAKVADFGFARLGPVDDGKTHISTQIKGTAGYMDPEYLQSFQVSEKSDVYSFGVLLVELISGRRPLETKRTQFKERVTIRWAMNKFIEGNAADVLDPNIEKNPATNLAAFQVLELASGCLNPTKEGRPSMKSCAEVLWNVRKEHREQLASDPHFRSSNSHWS